ncbi:MAG: eL32 family ribosomal protein [Candidatus Pacearchaeota archaeon]
MIKQFLRRTTNRYAKLGKGRKKKQVWRSPKGRDNKMREKRRGYPAVVSVGYRKGDKERKKVAIIKNLNDLKNAGKDNLLVLGKVGRKKKAEIMSKAKESKITFQNINPEKFLEKFEAEIKRKEEKSASKNSSEKKDNKKDEKKEGSKESGDKK